MQLNPLPYYQENDLDCLQLHLCCRPEEVDTITRRGWLYRSLLPFEGHRELSSLVLNEVMNKTLLIQIPPGHSCMAILNSIRGECAQIQDELEQANQIYRQERYGLGVPKLEPPPSQKLRDRN